MLDVVFGHFHKFSKNYVNTSGPTIEYKVSEQKLHTHLETLLCCNNQPKIIFGNWVCYSKRAQEDG